MCVCACTCVSVWELGMDRWTGRFKHHHPPPHRPCQARSTGESPLSGKTMSPDVSAPLRHCHQGPSSHHAEPHHKHHHSLSMHSIKIIISRTPLQYQAHPRFSLSSYIIVVPLWVWRYDPSSIIWKYHVYACIFSLSLRLEWQTVVAMFLICKPPLSSKLGLRGHQLQGVRQR